MIKSIEASGRSMDEAIANALEQLGLERDEVSVEVLESAKAGFLGIGGKMAVVKVSYEVPDEEPAPKVEEPKREEPRQERHAPRQEKKPAREKQPAAPVEWPTSDDADIQALYDFLAGLFQRMGVKATASARRDGETGAIKVELMGEHLGALIGRQGETLDAIQHLSNYIINHGRNDRVSINIDAENYRAKRTDTLARLAQKVAGKVVKYRRSVTLEPMNAYERHVIHTTLQDYDGVSTSSIGTEPNRRVVVSYEKGPEAEKTDRYATREWS